MKQLLAGLALSLSAMAAQADEISGDWCSPLGAHLRIEGEEIVTPGGQRTHGVYGRHSYEFIVPDGEEGAGLVVRMQQLSEEQMVLTYEGRDPEEWRRCQVVS
ncbi:hypothetical protein RXV86_04640 [Alisedimentitalea sp. MJ-SS2]|uniref:hypothetical protein n=1 Tax=Aliisedimentitalea sp. MJ-SS2 TaxID=3049795 RepID=UPI00290D57CE|nr:hypothetical protein [Alisedimentitalea sp. MJ-SS2]MDU8926667.1 hypothetical protein [Alisedimentitalea sp. MJ-SS2]